MASCPVYFTSLCALLSENRVKQSSISVTTGLSWEINFSSNSTEAGSLPVSVRSLIPKIPKCKVKLEITDRNKSQQCFGTDKHAFSLFHKQSSELKYQCQHNGMNLTEQQITKTTTTAT
jgi:hypothetical protein